MPIIDNFIRRKVEEGIAERLPQIQEEWLKSAMRMTVSVDEAQDYAMRFLVDSAGHDARSMELPQLFTQQVLRDSSWLYQTHGLAFRITQRILTIVFEGGIDYEVSFDDGFPDEYAREVRKRLDYVWFDEDIAIQSRAKEFVTELLKFGERGWRFFPILNADGSPTGKFRVGDIDRTDVHEIQINQLDKRQMLRLQVLDDAGKPDEVLECMRKNDGGFLSGDALYFRLESSSSQRRGTPVLQRVVDELKAEKKFRVRASDRTLARMAIYWLTKLKGMTPKQAQEFAAKQPRTIPAGGIVYEGDGQETKMESAGIEAGEVTTMMRTLITIIVGSFGHPISWYGFGDASNRSTAETQQDPAAQDFRTTKGTVFSDVFEKFMYYALDQLILARLISTTDPREKVEVKDADGNMLRKPLRECITIKVMPRPLEKRAPAEPLAATKAAMEIMTIAADIEEKSGAVILTPEKKAKLLTYASGADGTMLEFEPDEFEQKPGGAFPEVG